CRRGPSGPGDMALASFGCPSGSGASAAAGHFQLIAKLVNFRNGQSGCLCQLLQVVTGHSPSQQDEPVTNDDLKVSQRWVAGGEQGQRDLFCQTPVSPRERQQPGGPWANGCDFAVLFLRVEHGQSGRIHRAISWLSRLLSRIKVVQAASESASATIE